MTRTLVGGVGYTNLRDLSAGPLLVERLATEPWPPGVEVRDLGYGAVHVVHDLQDAQADEPYGRAVIVGAVQRGRLPGTITTYRWDGVLPDPAAVQAQVGDAVTGVISLDSLLIVGRQFGALPDEVIVVEIEPLDETWGAGCSPTVEGALAAASETIRRAALAPDPGAVEPAMPLGGYRPTPIGSN